MVPARRVAALAASATLVALALGMGATRASFTGAAGGTDNSFTAAPDFRAPTVVDAAIGKGAGGSAGFIHQAGAYRVYARVTDTGNPPSGVAGVTADVSAITAGQAAVPLSAGTFAVGGATYTYRSALLSAGSPLAAGPRAFTLSAGDAAGNAAAQGGFQVTVDNTAPAGTDVQTQNLGATVRKAEPGDTITFTFSEPIDPWSVLADWAGGATPVVVRLINGTLVLPDSLQVYDAANAVELPLGEVRLAAGYVGGVLGGETGTFGASGTASEMVMSGSTVKITLGTAAGQAATTALLPITMSWTPSSGPTDRAGNATSTADVSESGAADGEF